MILAETCFEFPHRVDDFFALGWESFQGRVVDVDVVQIEILIIGRPGIGVMIFNGIVSFLVIVHTDGFMREQWWLLSSDVVFVINVGFIGMGESV